MRKIVVLNQEDPVPDGARPIGVIETWVQTSERLVASVPYKVVRFYYDVPAGTEKVEKKNGSTTRRKV